MTTYMTNVIGTNQFGGPFSYTREIQRWVDQHEYDPNEWEFEERTAERINKRSNDSSATELKNAIDNNKIDYPCGAREFDDSTVEAVAWTTESGYVEVSVIAICEKCGFQHSDSDVVNPDP